MIVGDRVLIARQPWNQCVQLVGEVGTIREIEGDLAEVHTDAHGFGTVPLACLNPLTPDLVLLAESLDQVRND